MQQDVVIRMAGEQQQAEKVAFLRKGQIPHSVHLFGTF